MATTLYLIRHGATEGAEEKRYKGSIDVPLSALGTKQARRAAAVLPRLLPLSPARRVNGDRPGAVYSSPLSRARDTAEIIAETFGMRPEIIPALRERHFGRWEGLTFEEVRDQYPREFAAWMENPRDFSPPGGENTRQVSRRVLPAVREVLARHQEGQVILVAHGGVNRVLMCRFLGMPLKNIFRLEQDFAAINIIDFYDDLPVIKALNLVAGGENG